MDMSSALSIQSPMTGLTSLPSMNGLASKSAVSGTGEDPKLKKVCVQLEGVFFDMMLKEMRKTVDKSKLMGDSQHQQEIFQGMMDESLSQQMAVNDHSNNGLANMLYKQLAGRRAYSDVKTTAVSSEQAAEIADPKKGSVN
jgi:Rod binding domain-containing protein